MNWEECKILILQDYNRKKPLKIKHAILHKYLKELIVSESFKLSFWFRIISYLQNKSHFSKLIYYLLRLHYINVQRKTGIQLPIGTKVGGGICFCHFGSIVIANTVIIGNNCSIHPGVTIGRVFSGSRKGVPTIGDNVVIFAGAKILGNVNIGDNVVIGANAVVIEDIPKDSVAVGVPAKIVSKDSSRCFDEYWGSIFEHDYKES